MVAVSPLHRVAELVQKFPLSLSVHGGSSSDRGFFAGLDECIEELTSHVDGKVGEGMAFGQGWPFVEFEGHILAPALPVPVSTTEVLGPDGGYQRTDMTIERESAGLISTFLDLKPDSDQPSSTFDLLWFSENERFVLDGPFFRISSLFAEFSLPASRRVLDPMLRFKNIGQDVLNAWEPAKDLDQPVQVCVGKPLVLIDGDRWKNPEAYLARRPDVKEVDSSASALVVTAIDDERAVYQSQYNELGWTLDLIEGRSLYPRVEMRITAGNIILTAGLDASLDAQRSDVRARIAFDLNGDLQNS